jgi:regulator of replication initiation timing
MIHHKKSTSSSSSASPPTVVVKIHEVKGAQLNGIKKVPLIGNPEFELSTDTDEESLGEPDSSNHIGSIAQTPADFVSILLKTNSKEDQKKILDLVQYMEKDITQSKEAVKNTVRDSQQVIEELRKQNDELRKENELLKSQVSQQHKMSVIATASSLSSSSSSSSSSLSSNSSYEYEQQKPNVIIKPPKKSILRITPLIETIDCKPTATSNNNNCSSNSVSVSINSSQSTTTPSIVIMPKCEDIINNNNTKMFNNNNNNNGSSTTTVMLNGQTTPSQQTDTSATDIVVNKTAIKVEKL